MACQCCCGGCEKQTQPVFKAGDKVKNRYVPGLFILTGPPRQPEWAVKAGRPVDYSDQRLDVVSFQTGEKLTMTVEFCTLVHGRIRFDQ